MTERVQEITAAPEQLIVQFETLQSRVALHGNRLWQLPFTYVSFSAIASALALDSDSQLPAHIFFFGLFGIGVIVLFCMYGAWRGYRRTALNMNELEEHLGLGIYTKYSAWHWAPYFAMCAFAMAAAFVVGMDLRPAT